ncbi:MAG: AAA family ATPase [Mariprofundaceae bacterium]|nr:AAA family ATPase [Mariprofundaceae bacterium]
MSYDSSDDHIYFNLKSDDTALQMKIETKSNFDLKESKGDHRLLDIFDDACFCYLKTDRVSPANDFPFSEEKVNKNLIGSKGEYKAHFLAEKNHHILDVKALKHPKSITYQLLENASHWLGEISSGVTVSSKTYPELQRVSLSYQYEYGGDITFPLSPLHVGFGLTYVLPVIVAILKSKAGDFIVIENPESHLHPKGQARMAELCAIAAHNGVQIIVETHSDHFLNNKVIAPDESQIYYFKK